MLVTGLSGAGTSSVLAELARRGHEVLDTALGGWTYEVVEADGSVDYVQDEPRMAALLARERLGTLFVSGCVSNQGSFCARFAAVVLLSAPVEVLLDGVATRTTNDYGKDPVELPRTLDDTAVVQPLLRPGATVEVDTRLPWHEVADAVEAFT